MTNFKGTKGNWEITEGKCNGYDLTAYRVQEEGEGWDIAAVWADIEIKQAKANTLLISKSPQMLEMLEELLNNSDVPNELYDKAKQLIKEATSI